MFPVTKRFFFFWGGGTSTGSFFDPPPTTSAGTDSSARIKALAAQAQRELNDGEEMREGRSMGMWCPKTNTTNGMKAQKHHFIPEQHLNATKPF